ncbi:hypothetical protein EDEG_00360 [Edhazardia aedis USNM 41457]|uniref:Uncharacterized protein n=1 Tax=Edhazardia aedis (strain USNM 41457) TaxID=1003232 RepID=J9D2G4_EDHAE|nr:hypothetical protein EDEG_00360 [Edhazardia aedis USNM 41457]|eukprot:EJW01769.1 hypothetical protein EDEG_00360 [Edhazardia aedis USNM 41457]
MLRRNAKSFKNTPINDFNFKHQVSSKNILEYNESVFLVKYSDDYTTHVKDAREDFKKFRNMAIDDPEYSIIYSRLKNAMERLLSGVFYDLTDCYLRSELQFMLKPIAFSNIKAFQKRRKKYLENLQQRKITKKNIPVEKIMHNFVLSNGNIHYNNTKENKIIGYYSAYQLYTTNDRKFIKNTDNINIISEYERQSKQYRTYFDSKTFFCEEQERPKWLTTDIIDQIACFIEERIPINLHSNIKNVIDETNSISSANYPVINDYEDIIINKGKKDTKYFNDLINQLDINSNFGKILNPSQSLKKCEDDANCFPVALKIRNINLDIDLHMPLACELSSLTNSAIEMGASCKSKETKSIDPNKILKQAAINTLVLGAKLENYRIGPNDKFKSDLIFDYKNIIFIVNIVKELEFKKDRKSFFEDVNNKNSESLNDHSTSKFDKYTISKNNFTNETKENALNFLSANIGFNCANIIYIRLKRDYLLNTESERYKLLRKFEINIDKNDMNFIYEKIKKQSSHLLSSPFYSIDTLDFFAQRFFPPQAKIFKIHRQAAKNALCKHIKNFKPKLQILTSEIKRRCFDLILSEFECKKDKVFDSEIKKFRGYISDCNKITEDEHLNHLKEIDKILKDNNNKENIIINGDIIGSLSTNIDYTKIGTDLIEIEYNEPEIHEVICHEKIIRENLRYSVVKEIRDFSNAPYISQFVNYTKKSSQDILELQMKRLCIKSAYYYDLNKNILAYKKRFYSSNQKLAPGIPIVTEKYSSIFNKNFIKGKIDLKHVVFLKSSNSEDLIELLLELSIYQELRIKKYIAMQLKRLLTPNKPQRIYNPDDKSKYYEICIKGQIQKNDCGVAYISYFEDKMLIRSEKWRTPDYNNFQVCDDKLVVFIAAIRKQGIKITTVKKIAILYGTLLSENSWGISKVLKTFRYVCHGFITNNPFLPRATQKFVDALRNDPGVRRSYAIIYDLLKNSDIDGQNTLLFKLPLSMIAWEVYLMNLCPKTIYGTKKHLFDVLKDLNAEIDLFDLNISDINGVYEDFERIIKIGRDKFTNVVKESGKKKFENRKKKLNDDNFSKYHSSIISNDFFQIKNGNNNMENVFDDKNTYPENLGGFDNEIFKKHNQYDLLNTDERIILKELEGLYYRHFGLIETLSNKTNNRFTFSPVSVLLVTEELDKIEMDFSKVEGYVPFIEELFKHKASFDSIKMQMVTADKSIYSLTEIFRSQSTSLIGFDLIDSTLIDLTMRMYTKDQHGGNREISIMSCEMRVLQIIAESFFKSLNAFIENEFSNESDKYDVFIEKTQNAFNSSNIFTCSIDQTRWGPNFNTLTFGLLALSCLGRTKEAYLPALIYFLSEFKVFEIPPWQIELYQFMNIGYSLPGRLGRNHMGQGIFNNASSAYHALVTKFIQNVAHDLFFSMFNNISWCVKKSDSFITSDDVAINEYIKIYPRSLDNNFKTHDMGTGINDIKEKKIYKNSMFLSNEIHNLVNQKYFIEPSMPAKNADVITKNLLLYSKEYVSTLTRKKITLKGDVIGHQNAAKIEKPCDYELVLNQFNKLIEFYYLYDQIIVYFGIKMSDYKNMYSYMLAEFNSQYVGKDFISYNDIKFISSYIFYLSAENVSIDILDAIYSFKATLNSGVTKESAICIAKMNFLNCLERWNIDFQKYNVVSDEQLEEGLIHLTEDGMEEFIEKHAEENAQDFV